MITVDIYLFPLILFAVISAANVVVMGLVVASNPKPLRWAAFFTSVAVVNVMVLLALTVALINFKFPYGVFTAQ